MPSTPSMSAVLPDVPTQPAMPAVTIESRMAVVEQYIRNLDALRPSIHAELKAEMIAELKAEMASIRSDLQSALATGLAKEASAREALENRMTDLTTKVDNLTVETKAQTASLFRLEGLLKPFSSIISHPKVQTAMIGLVLTVITILTGWLVSKGHVTP